MIVRLEDEIEEMACRVCGCTNSRTCPGGCSWIEDDLCSNCDEDAGRRQIFAEIADEPVWCALCGWSGVCGALENQGRTCPDCNGSWWAVEGPMPAELPTLLSLVPSPLGTTALHAVTLRASRGLGQPFDHAEGVVIEVLDERARQIEEEGYDPEHDDDHTDGVLAHVAGELAVSVATGIRGDDAWGLEAKHEAAPRRALVIAAALLLAEIERYDRGAGG